MEFKEYGFGMFGWEGDDVIIAGGIRDEGHHPKGKMRCVFMAYDKTKPVAEGKQAEDVAKLVLMINLAKDDGDVPTVDKFINIEIKKQFRGQGLGRRIVGLVMEAAATDVEICDIKPKARKFWEKVGAVEFGHKLKFLNATIKKIPAAKPAVADVEETESEVFAM